MASIKLSLRQYIDTGAVVEKEIYYNLTVPGYTISFNSFSASLGLQFDF